MRVTRRVLLAVVVTVSASVAGPLGAASSASFVQKCAGPPPSTQSGRASLAPGVNRLSVSQQISMRVSLFDCSPASASRGAGTLRTTIVPKGSQTCTMLTAPKVFKATAVIAWKNDKKSTLSLTFSLTGATRLMNLQGKVTSGQFKGHSVTGQLRYALVVSPIGNYPNGDGVTQACKNKVPPQKHGRVDISSLKLYSTKHFVIA